MVDGTVSNDAFSFCQQMYALELLAEALGACPGNITTRIGSYLYPESTTSATSDMRFFKVGDQGCYGSVESFHLLMEAVSLGRNNVVRDKVLGSFTLPHRVLDLVADDIETEIENGNAPINQRRIAIILTDGTSDGNQQDLESAVQRLSSSNVTLIVAGIASRFFLDQREAFQSELITMANGDARNAIVAETAEELSTNLLMVMVNNGVIGSTQG